MTAGARRPDSPLQRVVGWLRAGYPDGVPEQDYVALFGILRRHLTDTEITQVVAGLAGRPDSPAGLTHDRVEQRLQAILRGPALAQDEGRVSSRLAQAGWPLGAPDESQRPVVAPSSRPGLVVRIVDWLRQGYPQGLPESDFLPLFALLRRRLGEDEVAEVGRRLVDDRVLLPDRVDIAVVIAGITSELPSEADIERVKTHLDSHDWPVQPTG